jgi:hypothetical protein
MRTCASTAPSRMPRSTSSKYSLQRTHSDQCENDAPSPLRTSCHLLGLWHVVGGKRLRALERKRRETVPPILLGVLLLLAAEIHPDRASLQPAAHKVRRHTHAHAPPNVVRTSAWWMPGASVSCMRCSAASARRSVDRGACSWRGAAPSPAGQPPAICEDPVRTPDLNKRLPSLHGAVQLARLLLEKRRDTLQLDAVGRAARPSQRRP